MRRFADPFVVPFVLAQPSAGLIAFAVLAAERGHPVVAVTLLSSATTMLALLRVRG